MANLLEILNERIVLGDGATGTYLYELGVPLNHCLEEVNLSRPELLDAGLSRVRRCRRAGDRDEQLRREPHPAGPLTGWNIRSAKSIGAPRRSRARRSRDATFSSADRSGRFRCVRPTASFRVDDRKALFREQIGALLEGGCDLIFLETFTALDELLLALGSLSEAEQDSRRHFARR